MAFPVRAVDGGGRSARELNTPERTLAMRIDVIDEYPRLCDLKDTWQNLYDADPEAHFFLSWTWMSKWLEEVVPPWIVLAARPERSDEGYVAFFPLRVLTRFRQDVGLVNVLQAACHGLGEYTGLICHPDFEDQAIPAFAKQLRKIRWATLDLRSFSSSDKRFNLILAGFAKQSFRFEYPDFSATGDKIDYGIAPYIDLPDSWDDYLTTKLRSETRRKARRFLRQVEDSDEFRITHANADTLDRDLDFLLRLWALMWGSRYSKNLETVQRTDRMMLEHAFDEGALFLSVFWKNDQPLGALAALIDRKNKSLVVKLHVRDDTFRNPSPGFVLFADAIRYAIGEGFKTCDFMRGNHPYKYSFGVDEASLHDCLVHRRPARDTATYLDKRWLNDALALAHGARDTFQFEDAERGYRQVLKVDPRNRDAREALAQERDRKRDQTAAVQKSKNKTGRPR